MRRMKRRPPQPNAIRSHSQVAEMIGVSRQEVRRVEAQALRKLREGLMSDPVVREFLEGTKLVEARP